MPRPAHTRVTFRGTLGASANPYEEWSFNINLGDVVFEDLEAREAAAQACHASWAGTLAARHGQNVSLTSVRVAQVGADGLVTRAADGSYNQGDFDSLVTASGSPAVSYSPQTALCVSLVTARPGPSGKGRFFMPPPRYAIVPETGRLLPADVTATANSVVSFLQGVDAAIVGVSGVGGNIVVASTKGFLTPVIGIKVGDVLDTMRSRRRQVIEAYTEVPLAQ